MERAENRETGKKTKKKRGREGHQGRMCKMNIKVEKFSTATDNS